MTISDTTAGASDTFTNVGAGSDGHCGISPVPGPDLVYMVMVQNGGTLTASLDASYASALLDIRSACADTQADTLNCNYRTSSGTVSTSTTVQGGSTYYVVVDSFAGQSGSFTLTLMAN